MLYQADWSSGRGGWVGGADWQAIGGMLVNDGTNTDDSQWITAPYAPSVADYAIEAEVQVVRTNGTDCSIGFGTVARAGTAGAYRASIHYDYGGATARLTTTSGGCSAPLGQQNFDPGTSWHTYRLQVQGNLITYFIDGTAIITTQDNLFLDSGQIGLWSDDTQINVRRFTVYGVSPLPSPPAATPQPGSLYLADWSTGRNGWIGGQNWKTVAGMLVSDGTNTDDSQWLIAPYAPTTPNYAIEAEVQTIGTNGTDCSIGFGLVARAGPGGAYRGSIHYDYGGASARLTSTPGGCSSPFSQQNFDPGTNWHTYRLEVQGNTLRLLIDGNPILTTQDNLFLDGGQVGLWSDATQIDVRRFEVLALPAPPPPNPTPQPGSLYLANWTSGLNGWVGDPNWKTVAGMLVNDGTNTDDSHWIVAPYRPATTDYAIEFEAQALRINGTDCQIGFGAVARASMSGAYRGSVHYDYGGPFARVTTTTGGCSNPLGQQHFDPGGGWHTYRLEVRGTTIRFLIDGNVMVSTTDNQFTTSGQIGLWSDAAVIDVRRFEVLAI